MIKFNKLIAAGGVLGMLAGIGGAQAAVLLSEGFDDITTLAGSGWVTINNSAPAGNDWFQGNDGIFISQSGAVNSYIANDFNSTTEISGVIDAWLIGPELPLPGGGMLTFFTRTADPGFSDKLEIRFSTGSSTNTSGFTTLLLTIGDVATPYPDSDWQAFSVNLPSAISGRFAFRYTVADALDADYIGIDTVTFETGASVVPLPSTLVMFALGLTVLGWHLRRVAAR
jgi:PEP-CTERM motif